MLTCDLCIFWTKGGLRGSGFIDSASAFGSCDNPKFVLDHSEKMAELDGVLIEDGEGWGFVTGPKFGCCHAKEKDRNNEQLGQ